ncbi:MAG: MBL fold metallo-hydrolase [Ruminococcaceae bacterium]|nr:MBL fold metallo-hydrolase [Oscillospiraceae bacterium]
MSKKHILRGVALVFLALVMCVSLCSCAYFEALLPDGAGKSRGSSGGGDGEKNNVVVEGDIEIHFLELGNRYTGDCTYIKAGDKDILIDAGSKVSSIKTIDEYIERYVTDKKLEYVIVTHAHEDHYAGFATYENVDSLFDLYECEVIIDFAQITTGREEKVMYKNYVRERDAEIEKGAKHYTAAECIEDETIKGVFDLGDGMSLTVLDSYYYYNKSTTENDHSVCTLLEDGKNSYLFTGDLEKKGEEKLVEMNDLPEVKLYKAGHHGSKTSSNEVLLEVIKPEIVCVCCCCGSPEYTSTNKNQFPTQAFVDRIAPYTDKVYVTTLCVDYEKEEFKSMNGDIIVRSVDGEVSVHCSASKDVLKDSNWFKKNRTTPSAWK